MPLTRVAERAGLTRATARRFLMTLEQLGYVRTDGRMFSLTPKVLLLGYAYLSGLSLPQIAEPHLRELSAQLSESTSVAILDDGDIVYVARTHTRRIMTVGITIGTRFPAYAASMGRVLLADLPTAELAAYLDSVSIVAFTPRTISTPAALLEELLRVRAQGWAFVDQELELGLVAMAAPIRNSSGRVIAAVNVSLRPRGTVGDAESLDTIRAALLATAARISADVAVTALG